MRRPGRHQRAGIAAPPRSPATKTAAGSNLPLELVNLATPPSGKGQARALSKTIAASATVVLGLSLILGDPEGLGEGIVLV